MATPLYYPPTQNAIQKTLGAQLLVGATASATLSDVTGIQNKKGIMVVDRVDTNGNATASLREYISFTGVSGSTVTGLTRGLAGSTDQTHAVGAVVEFVQDALTIQAIIDGLLQVIDTTGTLDTTKVVDLTTAQTLTTKTLTSPKIGTSILDTNGNELAKLTATGSAVNEITLANGATGTGPTVSATGDDSNIDINLLPKGTGVVSVKATASNGSAIRLYEDTDNGSNYVALKAPDTLSADKTYVLPSADGSSGQFLKTDGSGNLSFGSASGSSDGWTTDSGTTWTYASATTINVADGTLFVKGTRIKLTQTTAKYFVVTSIAGNVITVTGGTDYTVANAAITTQQYSHQASPVGYPTYFAYTPTFAGFSADPSGVAAKFSVIGASCYFYIYQGGNGTSNATTFTVTAPIANGSGNYVPIHTTAGVDNGNAITTPPYAYFANGSTTINCFKDHASGVWTNVLGKRITLMSGFYQI